MPYFKFLLYNTLGAAAWATVMVTLSYVAGQIVPLEQLVAWASRFAVLTLLVVVTWLVVPLWLESRKAKQEAAAHSQPPEEPTVESN